MSFATGCRYLEEGCEELSQIGDEGLVIIGSMAVCLWDVRASWQNRLKLSHEHLEKIVKLSFVGITSWF